MMNYSHAHQSLSQANFDDQRQETVMGESSQREELKEQFGFGNELTRKHPLKLEQNLSGSDL